MARKQIGKLNVEISANSSKFNRAVNSARLKLLAFGKGVAGIGGPLLQLAKDLVKVATVVTGVAAAAFVAGTKRAMEMNDALAKAADRIGLTTKALAGLHHAGKLSGVSVKTMNMALQRMVRRMGEVAVLGKGEAAPALERLGLDAKELIKMRPEQALGKVADALQGVETQYERVALAQKLFDSEGVVMVNTLNKGSSGLREAMQEAERFGLAISRVDAAKIEKANDSFTRLRQALSGIFTQISIRISPYLNVLADKIVNFGFDGVNSLGLVNVAGQNLRDTLISIAYVLDTIKLTIKDMQLTVPRVTGFMRRILGRSARVAGFRGFGTMMEAWGEADRAHVERTKERFSKESITLAVQDYIDAVRKSVAKFEREWENRPAPVPGAQPGGLAGWRPADWMAQMMARLGELLRAAKPVAAVSTGAVPAGVPSAIQRGTSEEMDYRFRARFREQRAALDIAKKQLVTQNQMAGWLKKISDATSNPIARIIPMGF